MQKILEPSLSCGVNPFRSDTNSVTSSRYMLWKYFELDLHVVSKLETFDFTRYCNMHVLILTEVILFEDNEFSTRGSAIGSYMKNCLVFN